MRVVSIILLLLYSSISLGDELFAVSFGYLSVDKSTLKPTITKVSDEIVARPGVTWGFIIHPPKKEKFIVKTIQDGNCKYKDELLVDGPYHTWGFYEYFEWSELTQSCSESIHIYINNRLLKTIKYSVTVDN